MKKIFNKKCSKFHIKVSNTDAKKISVHDYVLIGKGDNLRKVKIIRIESLHICNNDIYIEIDGKYAS